MKREFLKGLGLDEDTIAAVMSEHGKDIETYKGQVSQLQSDLDGKSAIIENNKTAFDNKVKEEVQKIKNDMLIDNSINDKFKDVPDLAKELLMDKIDRSKISVDDTGKVNGLDDQFNSLSEKFKPLWETQAETKEAEPNNPPVTNSGLQTGFTPKSAKSRYEGMDYSEYVAARRKEEKGE